MTIQTLTAETFESTVEQGIVVVDLWAAWCGPCRAFAPVFAAVAERHPDIVFAKLDTEAEPGLAGELDVRAIPTVMAFRDGVLVFARPGALSNAALESLIAQLRALDMNAVRAEVSARIGGAAAGGSSAPRAR